VRPPRSRGRPPPWPSGARAARAAGAAARRCVRRVEPERPRRTRRRPVSHQGRAGAAGLDRCGGGGRSRGRGSYRCAGGRARAHWVALEARSGPAAPSDRGARAALPPRAAGRASAWHLPRLSRRVAGTPRVDLAVEPGEQGSTLVPIECAQGLQRHSEGRRPQGRESAGIPRCSLVESTGRGIVAGQPCVEAGEHEHSRVCHQRAVVEGRRRGILSNRVHNAIIRHVRTVARWGILRCASVCAVFAARGPDEQHSQAE